MRGADNACGQLPGEVDLLLGEHGHARFEGLGGGRVVRVAYDPHTLAVVAAAHRLQYDREARALRGEGGDVRLVAHEAVAGHGDAHAGEAVAHDALVLGVHERVGPGAYGDAVRLQRPQVLGRHMFVIESDHVTAACETPQRLQVAVVTDDDVAHHLRRGVLRSV